LLSYVKHFLNGPPLLMLTEVPTLTTPADELPAGGDDSTRFNWKEAWYPVHYVADLDRTRPTRFTLLEQDLVLWWDQTAACWRAMTDQCPHRLAPLSEGRIAEDGLLECPYHGWAFRGDGTCDRIPQQPEGGTAQESKRACVRSFPTAERQGLLFVYPGQPERASQVKIPIIEPMEETPEGWICLNTFRDLPYDALTLLENVLDSSHVPFTHHKSVGNRANAAPVELELVTADKQGFQGAWAEGPRKGTLGKQDTLFVAPALMWHDLTSKQFGRTLTVVYATPIRKGECRLFARFPFRFSSKLPGIFIKLTPQWYSHINQNNILEDDQIFLHFQEHYLEAGGGSARFAKAFYLPTRADTFVSALRQWVNTYTADPFPGQALPLRQSTTALLDRYHSHTEHCASCRGALAGVQRLKGISVGAGLIGWTILLAVLLFTSLQNQPFPVAGVLAGVLPLLGTVAWLGLSRLEKQFYRGRAIPPRNQPDRKKSG
jgi:phenylpropionate dioxygenase-like ring-hydroxylating dioxygenase large terminal subunit